MWSFYIPEAYAKTPKHLMTNIFYVTFSHLLAERQNHAREMVREADLSQWDAVVIMSGDGLLFEVRSLWAHSSPSKPQQTDVSYVQRLI